MTETRSGVEVHGVDVPALLDRWARQGLLSRPQVEQILRAEGLLAAQHPAAEEQVPEPTTSEPVPARGQLAVEALGYLGGVLALAAGLLLVQLTWDDLPTGVRLGIPLGASAALLLAGALVPTARRNVAGVRRLRSVLWLLAVVSWSAAVAVFGDQVLEADGTDTWLLAGLGGLSLGLPLYFAAREAAQQLAVFGSAVVAATALGARADWDEPTIVGLAGWLVAATWFVLAERRLVSPALAGRYLGALGLIVFLLPMGATFAGQLVAMATITALLAWAVRVDSIGLLAVAAFGTLLVVPSMVTFFFPDNDVVIPLALLGAGGLLVGTAVVVARLRDRRAVGHPPGGRARR